MSSTALTKINFFDIPSSRPDSEPQSPFCARVRYVLNYKQLTYTTVWVNLIDVEAVCKKHGFQPTSIRADGSPRYTLPAIIDETSDNAISMTDSYHIVKYLDETYTDASRPLFPSSAGPAPAIHLLADAYIKSSFNSTVFPLIIKGIHANTTPESQDYWKRVAVGDRSLDDVALKKGTKEYREGLKKLTDALGVIAGFLELNVGAKWLLGDQPTFVDFVLLSWLRGARMADAEVWEAIKGVNGGILGRFVETGDVYMKW